MRKCNADLALPQHLSRTASFRRNRLNLNKAIAKFSCAYYLPADAIYTGEHTVMRDGLVFKLHSYVFLP